MKKKFLLIGLSIFLFHSYGIGKMATANSLSSKTAYFLDNYYQYCEDYNTYLTIVLNQDEDTSIVSKRIKIAIEKTKGYSLLDSKQKKEFKNILKEREKLREDMKKLDPKSEQYKLIMAERHKLRLQKDSLIESSSK